jgi:Fructose-2,6-bisphosphatase
MDRKIFLLRHGQIDYGNEKRYIGITDWPLSTIGIGQAKGLKQYFSGIEIAKAFTSPLKRCRQTAEIILGSRNTSLETIDQLTEINMGEWENQSIEYIRNRFPEMYEKRGAHIDTFVPPGGESFEQVQYRAVPAFEYIVRNTSGNVLIISHAGINRVILSQLLGFHLQDVFRISQPYACINELYWDRTCCRWQWEQRNYAIN